MNKYFSKLIISTAFITAFNINIRAVEPNNNIISDSFINNKIKNNSAVMETLLNRVLKQINTIDIKLESMAQIVNTSNLKSAVKRDLRDHILTIREFISKVKSGKLFKLNFTNLNMLLDINKTILAHINSTLENGLKLSDFNQDLILKKTRKLNNNNNNINLNSLEQQLNKNDNQLKSINKSFENIGKSKLNVLSKRSEDFIKKYNLDKIAKRSLPYLGLGIYALYRLKPSYIHNKIPFLSSIKDWIGTPPISIDEGADSSSSALPRTEKHYIFQEGTLSNVHQLLNGGILNIKADTVIDISLGGLFTPIIKNDFKDLKNWSVNKATKVHAYLKGESVTNKSLVKKPNITHNSFSNIVGFEDIKSELKKIVYFYKNKKSLDLSGINIKRGLLFAGPSDIGNSFANALAGEISKELAVKNKSSYCGVCNVHASDLVNNKLEEIIKEAEKDTKKVPASVIIIKEIDWLIKHVSTNSENLSKITSKISSILTNPKKQIFIVALTENLEHITSLQNILNLETIIKFEKPGLENRKEFFKKELTNRCIEVSNFDIDDFAQQTENCSFDVLKSIIEQAFFKAHSGDTVINNKHIEQAINEIAYNIVINKDVLQKDEKEILAAHFAGKALAHTLLSKQNKLIKVTISPIIKKDSSNSIKYGDIIDNKLHKSALLKNSKELENQALIELAGIYAQNIILNNVSNNLLVKAKQFAFEQAKKIVFEGLDEKLLPKSLREDKLTDSYDLVKRWEKSVSELFAKKQAKLKKVANKLKSNLTLSLKELELA